MGDRRGPRHHAPAPPTPHHSDLAPGNSTWLPATSSSPCTSTTTTSTPLAPTTHHPRPPLHHVPERWAETVLEDVAEYLQLPCHRLLNPQSRRQFATHPLTQLYPEHLEYPHPPPPGTPQGVGGLLGPPPPPAPAQQALCPEHGPSGAAQVCQAPQKGIKGRDLLAVGRAKPQKRTRLDRPLAGVDPQHPSS